MIRTSFDWLPVATTLLVTLVLCGTLVVLGATGWPGETGRSALEFCEALRPGPIKQPANTWSNLGFIAVALLVATQAGFDLPQRKSPAFDNPLIGQRVFPTCYAISSTLIGVGSAAMHASTTVWGARLDIYAMFLWASWVIAYSATRLVGRRSWWALCGFFVPLASILAVKVFRPVSLAPLSNADLFGVLIVFAILLELATRHRCRQQTTTTLSYLAAAVVAFLAAYAAWLPSRTGFPLCYPESLWQGHALWHILCAASVGFVYLYGRSERRAEAATAGD